MGSGAPNYMKVFSPSSINGFLEYRSKWFLEKIMKKPLLSSVEAERGKAVELGISNHLTGACTPEQAVEVALAEYDQKTADLDVDDAMLCRADIAALVMAGIEALTPYGKLIAVQRKIWLDVGKIPETVLPWMGYVDFIFEGNIIVDLKVTGRTPSTMPAGHSRQGAFYAYAIPETARTDFVYLVPLKKGVNVVKHTLENQQSHFEDLRQGAIALHRVLSFSDDPNELTPIFFPDPHDWWLKDLLTRNIAKEVWSFA